MWDRVKKKKKKVRGSQLCELGNHWDLPPDKQSRGRHKRKYNWNILIENKGSKKKVYCTFDCGLPLALSLRVPCSLCLSWICSAWRQGVAEPLHPPPSASITPRDAVLTITRPTFHTSNIFIHCVKAHYVTSEQRRFPIKHQEFALMWFRVPKLHLERVYKLSVFQLLLRNK